MVLNEPSKAALREETDDDPEGTDVYVCDVVAFVNEWRLFIGTDPTTEGTSVWNCRVWGGGWTLSFVNQPPETSIPHRVSRRRSRLCGVGAGRRVVLCTP